MPGIIRSVRGRATQEKVIERSRFIACCAHVSGEAEAKAFVAEIAGMHPAATHNCYAFVADRTGALQRFSDDGEPQGTAGMPILDVLKNKKLFETAVVVTRYFGGIKLGAGGLVRAYSGTAAEALDSADIREYTPCREVFFTVGYENFDALKKYLSQSDCAVKDTQYSDKVRVLTAVKAAGAENFVSAARDFMAGRADAEEGEEYLFPFPLSRE